MKNKILSSLIAILSLLCISSCTSQSDIANNGGLANTSGRLPGDSTLYGLACDGCSDSVLVFLSNDGGDPVRYNIINATRNKQVFGDLQIGDWVAVVLNPKDTTEARMVIDLDQLKGTWTFQVIPKLKKSATMTEEEILASMTDSMKKTLFVPREYGFTLKRHYQASPVGRIMHVNTLEDDSPVEYPKVTNYTSWRIYNGWLYLYTDTVDEQGKRIPQDKVGCDKGQFVFLGADSMACFYKPKVMQYHRKESAMKANEKAQKAVEEEAKKDTLK
jgi:hypothetical protein